MNEKIKLVGAPRLVLALEDCEKMNEQQVADMLIKDWSAPSNLREEYEILIAYQSEGNWGCDSSGWFLLRLRATGALFEVSGSHCSCYGFEDQFSPEATTVEYLKSDKFSVSTGGYDRAEADNIAAIKKYIAEKL